MAVVENSKSIFDKCSKFTRARDVMALGLYPYFRMIESAQEPVVTISGRQVVMAGSNNYLGLANHPKVKEAAIEAIRKYGTGCAGSRFLNGTLDIHVDLENKLAQFMRTEAALIFTTGFQVNLGVISALVGKDDTVVLDKMDHASIIDGCRLSYGEVKKFRHNNMDDYERVLKDVSESGRNTLTVVDGVFSMEGDIVNLPGLVTAAKKYNSKIMVDDAHGIGVLGRTGRGTVEHFGLEADVDLIMGTYSKSLASVGGFIAGSEAIIHYIKHFARSLIFSASPTPATVATVSAALDIIESEPERIETLWKNTRKMMDGFKSMGFKTGPSQTPIVPVIVGEDELAYKMCKMLLDEGVFVNVAVPPAVTPGMSLVRTSFMATHTDEHLDIILSAFQKTGRAFGVIK
ncbi:aminotransferase class I/II-fold pyridoxal phosphate-dependent enzyme [Candidatus Magnetomonas plexicatena]|uniref:aminotransferase class I/II-fold pyridoxal phosphate-dependent enzyme n=1 Tax=Candidatus Magnetomonas plexicatena TaxID=2552947 RepID=UPI001C78C6BC|nr:pyridoxal phosphate-dependent aminotransferase family protein [Nitrospirales bacterium LBB_01]